MKIDRYKFCKDMLMLERLYRRTDDAFDYTGIDSKLGILICELINSAVDSFLEKYKSEEETIKWWIWETDFGKKEMKIIIDGKVYIPKTARELYKTFDK